MKRSVLWVIGLSLLALSVAGCGASSEAGQSATAGGQARPSPEVVDPASANPTSRAAGETPSILGATPEAGHAGVWERRKLWDTWDVGYPDGWQVEQSEAGATFTGAYGGQEYRVEMTQPAQVSGDDLAEWARSDLAASGQGDAVLTELSGADVQSLKAANLALEGTAGACPASRVYAQGRTGENVHRLIITVIQTGGADCDTANLERLADALIAEARL